MLLNPSIVADPQSNRLHMLFRSTGPWPQARLPGKPLPYPIFLGYAWSDDDGASWQADWSRPALSPRLAQRPEDLLISNRNGERVINYANGCIEDPRFFFLEDNLYVSVACRMFPPGPYWDHDDPMQCAPDWVSQSTHHLGAAAEQNLSVTCLFEVNLPALTAGNYSDTFAYVTHLSDSERGDNRDVFLFPEKLKIAGKEQYVALHRPFDPVSYGAPTGTPPSIYLSTAQHLEDFPTNQARHQFLAQPEFRWEGNRVGASWVPIALGSDEWLIPYHAKQDDVVGYTQSFMITAPDSNGWPSVIHRCSERLLYATEPWQHEGPFDIPCLFTCGGIVQGEDLIMSYGAADYTAGIVRTNFSKLVAYVRRFDAVGKLH